MVYFIALKVYPNVRIESLRNGLKSFTGEFVKNDQLHLTILFLGKKFDAKRIKRLFSQIDRNPIEMSAEGFKILSDSRYKNAVTLRVENKKDLKDLHNLFNTELGGESLFKKFIPHISLLRTNEEVKGIEKKKFSKFNITLKKLALIEAENVNNATVYKTIFELNLDEFENKVQNILGDLENLKKFGASAAVLYGSTAFNMIKKPVHDIDIMLVFDEPTIVIKKVDEIRKFMEGVCKKYSDEKVEVKTWAVGLGKILEDIKTSSNKLKIGIEIFLLPKVHLLTNLSESEIEKKDFKLIFGKPNFLPKNKFKPESSIEFVFSRFLSNVVESDFDKKLLETYFNQLLFAFFEDKKIFVGSKTQLIESLKSEFPHINIPENISFNSLFGLYKEMLEEL